ncbi:unnamed protein product, partial [marine sediment metagenome]
IVTQMQQLYPSIVAVHTDSIISTKPLAYSAQGSLGQMIYELEGNGVILGSGLYQIGDKNKTRGFHVKNDLMSLLECQDNIVPVDEIRPYSWREVLFHNWELDLINRFQLVRKNLNVNFDIKRNWMGDYESFEEVKRHNVDSLPLYSSIIGV